MILHFVTFFLNNLEEGVGKGGQGGDMQLSNLIFDRVQYRIELPSS